MTLNVLSLFSGVGGMELGLEQAGMTTVGQVEWDDYCQQVLAQNWPKVARHDDVRTAPEWWITEPRPRVDLVCGGFPCQPFSLAGKQLGTGDQRWGWPWFERVLRTTRPRYVLLENVASLVGDTRAFGTILADLHRLGFDAEWATLRASDFGAPHPRERVYVLAYPTGIDGSTRSGMGKSRNWCPPIPARGLSGLDAPTRREQARTWLEREPRVGRLAHGIPNQSHRLKAAGNAVVPAITAHIGALIIDDHTWRTEKMR